MKKPTNGSIEQQAPEQIKRLPSLTLSAHSTTTEMVLEALKTSEHGLRHEQVRSRLKQYGFNSMPQAKLPGVFQVLVRQFASPLIYILVVAALFSLLIQEWSDAIFIGTLTAQLLHIAAM